MMISLTKENAFLGAEITCPGKTFYVVKINDKSVYLAKDKEFLNAWENRPKGITWKDYCNRFDVVMSKYDGLFISAIELSRGKTIAQLKENKSDRRYLSNTLETEVKNLYKRFQKGKGSWSHPIEDVKGKQAVIVAFSDDGQALIRSDLDFFFYDLETNVYTYYKRVGEVGTPKGIVFPRQKIIQKQ
jgi:hypothetical protein